MEAERVLKLMLEKNLDCLEELVGRNIVFKAILVSTKKEIRGDGEEASDILENIQTECCQKHES